MFRNLCGSTRHRAHAGTRHPRRARTVRSAATLMEVILAIAILGGSLAVLGEMVRVGARASRSARLLSTAQLLADSLAAEISAGISLPESTEGVVEQFGGQSWAYTVEVQQVEQQGLLGIVVRVRDPMDASPNPINYSLIRWLVDPEMELEWENAAAAAAEAAGTSESSSSTGSSSGSSGTASPTGGGG